jgi:hypothetical protein
MSLFLKMQAVATCFVACLGSGHLQNIFLKSIIEVPIIMPCKLKSVT